jgi:predicted GIY-YIG superfamily endonuclease
MLLRDRLANRLAEMGAAPDYERLAAEILGIRNAPPDLARRLVAQALVVEDRRDEWRRIGERVCANAPPAPGVYVLRDELGRALYVGKAMNLRRRLRTHFSERRWTGLKAVFARASGVEWREVGSELEALVREAALIAELRPVVNVQTAEPSLATRAIPQSLVRDVIVVVPSVDADSVELVAASAGGASMIQQTRRSGGDLPVHATRLMRFFNSPLSRRRDRDRFAPIVFSWLAGRGRSATRLDPHDFASARELRMRLEVLLSDERLFRERIVLINSKFRVHAAPRP